MFAPTISVLLYYIPLLFHVSTCSPELSLPSPPSLKITSPGELEYAAVLVKRVGDNLTLDCMLHGDTGPGQRIYVWNYVAANASTGQSPYTTAPQPPSGSRLSKKGLSVTDSGHYVCSAPPHSVSKLVLVQTRGPQQCARGAFWCGPRCVLAAYVCDGLKDCTDGEDEAVHLCDTAVCARPDKLNCSNGRCIPEVACCTVNGPLCRQPTCCEEHGRYSRIDGFEAEHPLFEDRRAPDEYGFIQSTIYTVTACALIFMIAVVLLVSAICKMHMKRAALRSYAAADRETRRHYSVQYGQAHRFPPCYETSRLLEQERVTGSPAHSPTHQSATDSPARSPVACPVECAESTPAPDTGFGLTRLSQLLSARYHYHQTPSSPPSDEVSPPGGASPVRTRPEVPADMYLTDIGSYGRPLNYMATPVEFYRSRALGSNLDHVMDQITRPRPLTLHLGRFQLSIPRLGRRMSTERRPDTPNIAELNIDDLDFVRLNSNDTYTLNGRTIRLLGANFENYPLLNDNNTARPPPYTEAMRYKLYGPPPEYLSRDALNNEPNNENNGNSIVITPVTATEQQARSNIEEPPCYEDLASGVDNNANSNAYRNVVATSSHYSGSTNNVAISDNVTTNRHIDSRVARTGIIAGSNAVITTMTNSIEPSSDNNGSNNVIENISSVIDNLPAIDSDVNANETDVRYSIGNGNNEVTCNDNGC